jgi:magnesium chelatase family protein
VGAVARTLGCALWGLETALVTVEVDVANGLPHFAIVGLPGTAVQEARERVRAAIRNAGFEFPLRRVTVNLAPAERRKEGTGFDLPIALAILRATGQLTADPDGLCLGALRPVRGAMPWVRRALGAGICRVYVPVENAGEAAALGAETIPFASLREAVAHFNGVTRIAPAVAPPPAASPRWAADLGDIVGQETPKRALEIAAAGGHNLLLVGPPGTGKALLARALPSILPPLDPDEAVEASAVYSVAGLIDPEHPLLVARPFRAPHHTASHLALVGGGTPPRPGEVSLAHAGALFLDEFAGFQPQVLPGPVGARTCAGTNALIASGVARVCLGADDLARAVGLAAPATASNADPLLDALAAGPLDLDELARRMRIDRSALRARWCRSCSRAPSSIGAMAASRAGPPSSPRRFSFPGDQVFEGAERGPCARRMSERTRGRGSRLVNGSTIAARCARCGRPSHCWS